MPTTAQLQCDLGDIQAQPGAHAHVDFSALALAENHRYIRLVRSNQEVGQAKVALFDAVAAFTHGKRDGCPDNPIDHLCCGQSLAPDANSIEVPAFKHALR